MPDRNLARARLVAQGLAAPAGSPVDVARSFGVMQGQDVGVFSSLALRTESGAIEQVFDALRTHELVRAYPMRGTVFLAHADDMRWITELCSATSAKSSRKRALTHYGLGHRDLAEVRDAVLGDARTHNSADGLTRGDFRKHVREALPTHNHDEQGIYYRSLFTMLVEHDVVYSGWDGRDQRIFAAESLLGPGIKEAFNGDVTAATAELLARYIRTHGPTTLRDFTWWSKLSLARIRQALATLPDDVVPLHSSGARELGVDAGAEFYVPADLVERVREVGNAGSRPYLVPAFDEFILGYQDRLFAMTQDVHEQLVPGNRGIFRKAVVVGGTVRGSWVVKRKAADVQLEIVPFGVVPKRAEPGLRRAFDTFPHLR